MGNMQDLLYNSSYIGERPDIQKLIPSNAEFILDIGCSTGVLGSDIKKMTGARVYGIEISEEMANLAKERIDKVFVGDVESVIKSNELLACKFDVIIFADILEHLVDPWKVLRLAVSRLNDNGVIVASIPNVRHLSTIFSLVFKGYWPYRERGLHDRTHLRFFTKRNTIELFKYADLKIDVINANYRLFDKCYRINCLARFFAAFGMRNFMAYQYLIKAHKGK